MTTETPDSDLDGAPAPGDPLAGIDDPELREAIRAVKDVVIVAVLKAVSDRSRFVLEAIANKRIKATARNRGYLEALKDLHISLAGWLEPDTLVDPGKPVKPVSKKARKRHPEKYEAPTANNTTPEENN